MIVIGAGPAGLTAAYLLAKTGHRVTVLEADDQVGGIARTAQYRGFRFDIGGHRFFSKIKPVVDLWEELLGDEFISVPRLSRIHYSGTFFDYPLRVFNVLAGLGLTEAFRIVLSYLYARLRPAPVEDNLEQWVTNRFGRRLYQVFFKTYTEKIWGIPCTEIRAEWAAQRIQGLSLTQAILRSAPLTTRSETIKTLIHEFRYPRLGPGQMWEACRDRIEGLGSTVLLNHRVTSIGLAGNRVVGVEATTPEGQRNFPADHVISSTDLPSLVRAIAPGVPLAVEQAASGLRYRDFIVVALVLDQENIFPDSWLYIHTPGVRVGRIQNFNNWSAAMVAGRGRTCLGFEYFCFQDDDLWQSSDAALLALATEELAQLGLAPPSSVTDGAVVRMPKAYPIYDGQYRHHRDTIRSYLDTIDNLQTVGRNGMHKYNNQDHSMLTAMMAVWNLQGAAYDLWAVNTDHEYHEEQRVSSASTSEGPSAAVPR